MQRLLLVVFDICARAWRLVSPWRRYSAQTRGGRPEVVAASTQVTPQHSISPRVQAKGTKTGACAGGRCGDEGVRVLRVRRVL